MKKKIYKLVLMFVDHDNLGERGVREIIHCTRYPNHTLAPFVMSAESVEVEWDDDHPLNSASPSRRDEAFRDLFPEPRKEECIEHLRTLAEEYEKQADQLHSQQRYSAEQPKRLEVSTLYAAIESLESAGQQGDDHD